MAAMGPMDSVSAKISQKHALDALCTSAALPSSPGVRVFVLSVGSSVAVRACVLLDSNTSDAAEELRERF